jgi:hypothetical protein
VTGTTDVFGYLRGRDRRLAIGRSGPERQTPPANRFDDVLDSFATVGETVVEMRKEAFRPVMVVAPNGVEGKIHLSISDASGDSAIFEYIKGKLIIYCLAHGGGPKEQSLLFRGYPKSEPCPGHRLNQVDFNEGSGVRKLTLHGNSGVGGDQATNFQKAERFKSPSMRPSSVVISWSWALTASVRQA